MLRSLQPLRPACRMHARPNAHACKRAVAASARTKPFLQHLIAGMAAQTEQAEALGVQWALRAVHAGFAGNTN
jgi:hypothetical protein